MTNRVNLRDTIRWQLKDFDHTDVIWEDNEVDAAIDRALQSINRREPKLSHTLLPIIDSSKSIDISVLENLIDVISVEYPFGEVPVVKRNFRIIGNTLILEIPQAVDVNESSLTGTVTFTEDSFSVSGSGTKFSTEIMSGYYIKKSSGSYWYRVASVVSDTSLILDMPFSETGGADTINSTKVRTTNDCAMVNWTTEYVCDDAYSDLPRRFEDLAVTGAVAYLLNAEGTKYANEVPIGAGAVGNYVAQADRAMAIYQAQLRGLGRIEDTMVTNFPIT